MTTEEAIYWKGYLDKIIADRLAALTEGQAKGANISTFADSYMQTITGQQPLPQGIFREFLERFAEIPKIQEDIEHAQQVINEWSTDILLYLDRRISEALVPNGQKEVIELYSMDGVEPANMEEGARWFDPATNTIYVYSEEDGIGTDEARTDCIYIDKSTKHVYIWDDLSFIDITGQSIDNTIYVRNIDNDLADITEPGLYNVCLQGIEWFSLFVILSRRTMFGRPPRVIVSYSQTLTGIDGWSRRIKHGNEDEWLEWEEHRYSYDGHTHTTDEIIGLSREATEEEINQLFN